MRPLRYSINVGTAVRQLKREPGRGLFTGGVKELSFIDDGRWGFEIADADGYVLAFFQLRGV